MSRITLTALLSSSYTRAGGVVYCSFATLSSQHLTSTFISALSSAARLFSAEVRMITPKLWGLMLSTSLRRRIFSAEFLIFCDTEILLLKGMSTIKRPVKVISVVSRGPLVEMGSFTICTSNCCPCWSTSDTDPCLSMSGFNLNFDNEGRFSGFSRTDLMNSEYDPNCEPKSR